VHFSVILDRDSSQNKKELCLIIRKQDACQGKPAVDENTRRRIMQIKQISVFLENNAGRLGEVTRVLAEAGINLRAISIADTADFGIVRLIADNPDKALDALKKAGYTMRISDVAAVEIEDKPGSLAKVMELFQKTNVNIEYLYASLEGKVGKAVVIFKLADHTKGLEIMKESGLTMVESF
jgi:hypothetical protein